MSYVVRCSECREKIYPEEPGGDPKMKVYEVALEHVNETGHHPVDVLGGHHYVGDGEPPREFSR